MGLLTWVLVPLAIGALLAARYHEAGLSVAHLCTLFSICFLALSLYQRRKSFRWHLGRPSSPNGAGATRINVPFQKVNDSLYELYRPKGNPTMQILFYHGLQSVDDCDTHVQTWKSEDGSVIWPRDWLAEDHTGAHIFTVSYNECLRNSDMYLVAENLTSDLIDGGIGQVPFCPVIFVGYCVGGLVIKQICLQARSKLHSGKTSEIEGKKLGMLLDNVRGVFYYGTPHHGSSVIADVADGPLFEFFKVLHKDAARLNSEFDDLLVSYPKCSVYGLGESLPTKSGMFRGHVVVPEAAAREGAEFNIVAADHNTICQPGSKVDRRYYALRNLINTTVTNMEEEAKVQEARPQNFQALPEEMVAIDVQVHPIVAKLVNVRKLALAGMGGLGKTTVAKAVFNELCSKFEYTCFVPNMKVIAGTEQAAKQAVWEHMHHHGKKVGGEQSWSRVQGQELLLVLDDISLNDVEVLLELAHDSAAESRFIATSRNEDHLSSLDEVVVVPFLRRKNAEELFMKCAFPNQVEAPLELRTVMKDIIRKCDGLPLTLEVLGKYLKRKRHAEEWEQTLSALKTAEEISGLNERLWGKLRPSFDDLTDNEQQIFLDATTFFTGERSALYKRWRLRHAKAAWRAAYGASEDLLWQTLVERSLVYSVGEDDAIKVHEQLQSLGQKIACDPVNIGKRRVWDGEVGFKMLRTTTEELDEGIHALRMRTPSYFKSTLLPKTALSKLKKVRFLEAGRPVTIDGSRDGASVPTEVVLLRCVGQALFNPSLQTHLAVLDLQWPLEDPLPRSIGQLERLKHLTIKTYQAWTLPSTFGQLRSLQRLTFSSARGLESLPESFGQLSSLNFLEFDDCPRLHSLPESFGQLKALQSLVIWFCDGLIRLPESFGQLKDLRSLIFWFCGGLIRLPESFGQLSTLTHLHLDCENLLDLPESFGRLTKLQWLNIYANVAARLPDSVVDFKALRYLEISYHSATSIPDWIKNLPSLQTFRLVFRRDLVEPLPPWLMTPIVPTRLSPGGIMDFRVRDGRFFLPPGSSRLYGRWYSRSTQNCLNPSGSSRRYTRCESGSVEE